MMDMNPPASMGGGPSHFTAVIPCHRASMGTEAIFVEVNLLARGVLLKAILQIQHTPLHGHFRHQALDEMSGQRLFARNRTIPDRHLVGEAGDVMQGPAIFAPEFRPVRIGESSTG